MDSPQCSPEPEGGAAPPCSLVLCTAPPEVAEDLAARVVAAGLAACVNLLPGVVSRYLWNGRPERAAETLLVIKTQSARVHDLTEALAGWHPYEVPEVIAVRIDSGLPAYLAWVAAGSRGSVSG